MGKKILTEKLPSSGAKSHEHDWQKLEEKGDEVTLVCKHENCMATKVVKKAVLRESAGGKKLLLG